MTEDYTMEKVMTLNESQFSLFKKDTMTKEIKDILGIPANIKYSIGDSLVMTKMPTLPHEVLTIKWNGKNMYYVVINPIDEERAFCYTVYPL